MNLQRLIKIRMLCPCCFQPVKLGINQINRVMKCRACGGQFEAAPDTKLNDVIRISAGCSVTKNSYAVAFKRGEFGKHRFFTTFTPDGLSKFWIHPDRFRPIPIGEVDFGGFECECGSRVLDFCSNCATWICQGAAHATPHGKMNNCPNCGRDIYDTSLTVVQIAEARATRSNSNRPRLPAGWGVAESKGFQT
jgi:hypothetical protein